MNSKYYLELKICFSREHFSAEVALVIVLYMFDDIMLHLNFPLPLKIRKSEFLSLRGIASFFAILLYRIVTFIVFYCNFR